MATVKFKHNGETLDFTAGRKTATRTYIVLEADHAAAALDAVMTELPLNTPHMNYPEIKVTRYLPRAIEGGVNTYEVDVFYGYDTTTLPPPDTMQISFEGGVASQQIMTGIGGEFIGSPIIWDSTANPPAWVYDEDHEPFGVDVYFPTIEWELAMPPGMPIDLPLYMSLLTKVNDNAFSILGLAIPRETCQYLGPVIQPMGTMPVKYQVRHRFRMGFIDLPDSPTASYWNGAAWIEWTRPTVPLRYAVVTNLAKVSASQWGTKFTDRTPFELLIIPVYKVANFGGLWGMSPSPSEPIWP